ncbi:MAG: carboxypeptidase M32 [Chloroflexota bacterium]
MEKQLEQLKAKLLEVSDLGAIGSLLNWDQSTYMPPGGAPARGRQMSMLAQQAQEKAIDPEIGKLLDQLDPWAAEQPYDSDDAALVRVARRNYDLAIKVPPALIGEFYAHGAHSYQVWTTARPDNNFAAVQDNLEKTLDLSRKMANCFPGYEHIADPLIDQSDYGMKATSVRKVFAELREQLVPLVKSITEKEDVDNSVLFKSYPIDLQTELGKMIITDYGFDFERGRQDLTHHPFMTKFSLGDIRITTRFQENDLGDGLFSTLHEAGHGMYELGINPAFEGSPLASGTSSGVHESQSRLWENIVGRSKGFWSHYLPKAQALFPEQLKEISLNQFYKAINKVSRSLIRVDADEVTYNLHVMIRFDLELQLLEGSLEVKDLPEAWHARYESDLGLRAPDDTDGAMQDVHWYYGAIGGMFQGYTLGNIMSSLFYDKALSAHPEIPDQIAQGEFGTLHGWMLDNIYQHGSKFTANELVESISGAPLTIAPYMDYLKTKYGEIYNL